MLLCYHLSLSFSPRWHTFNFSASSLSLSFCLPLFERSKRLWFLLFFFVFVGLALLFPPSPLAASITTNTDNSVRSFLLLLIYSMPSVHTNKHTVVSHDDLTSSSWGWYQTHRHKHTNTHQRTLPHSCTSIEVGVLVSARKLTTTSETTKLHFFTHSFLLRIIAPQCQCQQTAESFSLFPFPED